ncbi:hypothetical protein DOT_5222 [Desulfosporosinus sp. OT]|nr:hypothetical protein DOT_5222 [Desulfosporosinus sp. OT]
MLNSENLSMAKPTSIVLDMLAVVTHYSHGGKPPMSNRVKMLNLP